MNTITQLNDIIDTGAKLFGWKIQTWIRNLIINAGVEGSDSMQNS